MTLKAELEVLWNETLRAQHRDLTEAHLALIRTLSEADMVTKSLKVGDLMPRFLLPNAEGCLVDSDDLLNKGPLVVSFFRGEWCAFCTLELRALHRKLPELEQLGANLVAVTADTGAALRSAKEKYGLPFEVLSDVDCALGLRFGIIFKVPDAIQRFYRVDGVDLAARHGNGASLLPVPATFVVDRHGKICHAYVDVDFSRRMEPDDIVTAVRAISPQSSDGTRIA